jgi:hypothetical protein
MWHRTVSGITAIALLCAAAGTRADPFGPGTYWGYTYKSIDVVAKGSSSFAESIGRNLQRFDTAFAIATKLDLGKWRPRTHVYALEPSVLSKVWAVSTGTEISYRAGTFSNDIVMDSHGEADNLYYGAYFGYAGSLLVADSRLRFPAWFQVGVSGVFAASIVRKDDVLIGTYSKGQIGMLVRGLWIPMRTVLRLAASDPKLREDRYGAQYDAECWLLVHMALIDGKHRDELDAYITALSNGTPEEQAFTQNFHVGYEDLDNELHLFIQQGQFNQLSIKVPADTDSIVPVKLTQAQVDARLAELTVHARRDIDYGLKLAAQALAQEPGNEFALRAQSRGLIFKEQFTEAYQSVQLLLAVPGLSPMGRVDAGGVYGSLARAVSSKRVDLGVDASALWRVAGDAYNSAISSDPENLEAYFDYANLLESEHDLERIRTFLPQAEQAFYRHPHIDGLAQVISSMNWSLNDLDDALVFAVAWRRTALTPAGRDAADSYISRLRAAKARKDSIGQEAVTQ